MQDWDRCGASNSPVRRSKVERKRNSQMKLTVIGCAALLLAAAGWAAPKEPAAHAVLKNAKGEKAGTATFTEVSNGVNVAVRLNNMKPGVHGIHIHEAGKCDAPDFKTAGGHFNPTAKHHGSGNPQGMHMGDLRNISVAANGTGRLKETVKGITLGPGEDSLFHNGGTALVVHADPDDMKSDPAGNSGARIACGVIMR